MLVVAALIYLRASARRHGVRLEKEHWMVFGVFSAMVALSGVIKDNHWVSLIGLLLAVAGVVYHARLVLDAAKRRSPKQ